MILRRGKMRLDKDVLCLLSDEARRLGLPVDRVLNEMVRRALAPHATAVEPTPYRTIPHKARLGAGFDPMELNSLADELEDDARLRHL